jgi:hypothetical protein
MASTLHDRAPAAAPPPPAPRGTVVADRLRRLGRRERAIWAVAILVLALVPALVSAARSDTVRSEVLLEPAPGERARPGVMADYVRTVVNLPVVQGRIAFRRSRDWFLVGLRHADVDVDAAGRGGRGVRLTVTERTRRKARDLAFIVAREVRARSRGAARRLSSGLAGLKVIDRALRNRVLPAARRRELLAQRRFILVQARQDAKGASLEITRPPTLPAGDRIDRIVTKVAPDGAPHPHPLWAGFAGLLLGLALCGLWLALPAGRRAGGRDK